MDRAAEGDQQSTSLASVVRARSMLVYSHLTPPPLYCAYVLHPPAVTCSLQQPPSSRQYPGDQSGFSPAPSASLGPLGGTPSVGPQVSVVAGGGGGLTGGGSMDGDATALNLDPIPLGPDTTSSYRTPQQQQQQQIFLRQQQQQVRLRLRRAVTLSRRSCFVSLLVSVV